MKARLGRQRNRVKNKSSQVSKERLRFETLETRAMLTTTTAVLSGEWDDPSIWSNGVPDATTRAIVGSNVTVTLAGTDHVARELVVHGVLNVEESANSDFDSSGAVNGFDFLAWQRGFGTAAPNATSSQGDADGDRDVDNDDLGAWQQQYSSSPTSTTRTLTANWVHVNSGGVFQIGSEANPFDQDEFVLTLTGTNTQADHVIETATGTIQITDNDGFLMAAGGGAVAVFWKAQADLYQAVANG